MSSSVDAPTKNQMMGDSKRVQVEKWEPYLLGIARWRDQQSLINWRMRRRVTGTFIDGATADSKATVADTLHNFTSGSDKLDFSSIAGHNDGTATVAVTSVAPTRHRRQHHRALRTRR